MTSYELSADRTTLERISGLDKNIFLIDFGAAKKLEFDKHGKMMIGKTVQNVVGCSEFLSANALQGYNQTYKDDLISMMYTLIYLVNHRASWLHNEIDNNMDRYGIILKDKMTFSATKICQGEAQPMTKILEKIYGLKQD